MSKHLLIVFKLLAIAISFPIALALQCALLLYGTFGPIVDTGVALFLLIIVELVPLLLLVCENDETHSSTDDCFSFFFFFFSAELELSSSTIVCKLFL